MEKSLSDIYNEFGNLQKHLNNINTSLSTQNISNEVKLHIKNLKNSFIGLTNSLNASILEIDKSDKKHFEFYNKVTKNIDNYLAHMSTLGGSIGAFSFQSYKVIKDYTNLFEYLSKSVSFISNKIKNYKKNIVLKLSNIDKDIQESIINRSKYEKKVTKLQKIGDKIVNKQISTLQKELDYIKTEEDKLNRQKTRLVKVFGSEELQQQELQPKYDIINQQKKTIQDQLSLYEQKHEKYIQYITTFSKNLSKSYKEQQQKLFEQMISKNIKRMGEINKEIPELVKKAYDKSIKPELQINQLNQTIELQKMKKQLEEQNIELTDKIQNLNVNNIKHTSILSIFKTPFSIISKQFDKKSPLTKLGKGFMSIWGIFTKGIKILTKLPELLNPITWLFKIGTVIAGFVTLMVSSPTFRKLVLGGISKLGELLKEQFFGLQDQGYKFLKWSQSKIVKGLKWLVWDEPLKLIDQYISKPIINYFKSIPTQLQKAWIDVKTGISKQWGNVTSFITSSFNEIYKVITNNPVSNFIKGVWDNVSTQIKNFFGYIGYVVTHPFHHKSYSDYLKGLQQNQEKQTQKQIQENLKNYPVINPNNPLISGNSLLKNNKINYNQLDNNVNIVPNKRNYFPIITQLKQPDTVLPQYNITPEQNQTVQPIHKQNGGLVTGPGGQIDDKILTQLSNGEYIIPQNIVKSYPILISTLEQLRKNEGINTILLPIKNLFNNIISSTKSVYDNIKNNIISFKNNISKNINEGLNKIIKDTITGKFSDILDVIKDTFNKIKISFLSVIKDFNSILPTIKTSFIKIAESFQQQAKDISSEISNFGGMLKNIGLTSLGQGIQKIAGPIGIIATGQQMVKSVQDWAHDNIINPLNSFMHNLLPGIWQDPNKQYYHYGQFYNGGIVPGNNSLFDNVSQRLSSGEYVIPNYITTQFPSLIKKIENLRVSLLPNKNNIISTEFNKNILSNDNPLINILNTSNDNFNKLNNTLMKLFTDKKQQNTNNTVMQNNSIISNNVNSLNDYDLILGDISV